MKRFSGFVLLLWVWVVAGGWLGQGQPGETLLAHVNFVVIDDGVTELAANATFDGPEDAVGETPPLLPELFDLNILIIINQIYSQCAIAFEVGAVKVLRPELIPSPLGGGRTLADVFIGQGRNKTLELDTTPTFLDEFAGALRVAPGEVDPFELFRDAPHLIMFVVGATLTDRGRTGPLAVGQLNGRHSAASYKNFTDINDPTGVETLAHEWGHNFGLLHTDDDGLADTDGDPGNLMFPSVNPTGGGNRRLTKSQCAVARQSPFLTSAGE